MSERRYWYPGANGEAAGPVTAEAIRQSLASGVLRPASPLCVEGTREWRAASTYPELAEAVAAASTAPAPVRGAKPSRLAPVPYTPGAKPASPGPFVSYSEPLADLPARFEKLRVYDEPAPPEPGIRWRPRLLLSGLLLLVAVLVAAVDLWMGFPTSPWTFLIPFVVLGILLVVAATGAPRPRPASMRVRGPAGCAFALVGLPMLSALLHYSTGDSLSVSPTAWILAAGLGLVAAALIDNRESAPEPVRYDLARMGDCKSVVLALEHDAMPGKAASGWLDLTGPRQGSKVTREGRGASGRRTRVYRDEWWRLTVPLRDGNRLRVSAVELVKVKEAVHKRRRSKPEVAETVATVEVKLDLNAAAYRTRPPVAPAPCGELRPGPIATTPDSVSAVAALRGSPARFRSKDLLALLALVYAGLEPLKPAGGGAP